MRTIGHKGERGPPESRNGRGKGQEKMALELLESCGMILGSEKQGVVGAQAPVIRAANYSGFSRLEGLFSLCSQPGRLPVVLAGPFTTSFDRYL